MIGPHYQRLAEAQRQITGNQMLQRINSQTNNPMTMVIDKLKRQFSQYQTAYTEDITHHQISSVDRLLSFDGKLGPILAGIQKQNNLLRRELNMLESQLSNSVSICEQVINENNQLKQIVIQKNQDISKIIETVARNQSEARNQLEDKIGLLEQENNILIHHLEQIKKKHQDYSSEFSHKDDEIERWEKKWTETKKQLSEAIGRERDVTRKLAISEHLLFEEKERKQILDNDYNLLLTEVNDLKSKITLLQGTDTGFDPQLLRKNIEKEYMEIIQEHKSFKIDRQNLLRDLNKQKMQKQKLEDVIIDIEKKFNKVVNQYELTNKLLIDQKQKNLTLVNSLKKVQVKLDELKNQNVQFRMQSESIKSGSLAKQKILQVQLEDLRRQLHEKSTDTQRKLRDIQYKTNQLLDSKDSQIKMLKETNTELRRLIQK